MKRINRITIVTILLFSILGTLAAKKMSIHDPETVGPFDDSASDGLNLSVQECNSNWFDSIPYLVEHAKWKKIWALEALAECYRYGKGGVEKNMFNAIMCYEEAGKSARKIAKEVYQNDSSDEFGLINHLMEELAKERISEENAILLIDELTAPKPQWIVFLRDILKQKRESRKEYIESRLTPNSSSDEFLIGIACIAMDDCNFFDKMFADVTDDCMLELRILGLKLPPIYDLIAEIMWRKYEEDTEDKNKYLEVAMECMFNADRHGFLSKHNMNRILIYCEDNGIDDRIPFSEEDLARFDAICNKEYFNHINSAVAGEEEVVEAVEVVKCPVELFED